jgi:hypothetical protein
MTIQNNTFNSSALGKPHDYRAFFSDKVHCVLLGTNPMNHEGGNMMCRALGSTDPYSDIFHTKAQCKQVYLDMTAADINE